MLGGIERNVRAALLSLVVGQKLRAFVSRMRRQDLLVLGDLIERQAIVPPVERSYPLFEAPAAIRQVAAGRVRGKVVVTV